MAKPLNYTDDVDPSWAGRAMETLDVTPAPSADDPVVLELSGRCPRCDEKMEDSLWLITILGVSGLNREDAFNAADALREAGILAQPLLPAEFTVSCKCSTPHPDPLGRTDLKGCGATWKMRFEAVEDDSDE
ncbi:hypothetical protein [Amycolatopsis australiensis]|uniref:Uncharacterized protein n=1 Tax=Amycolatopsis australiensis TaxID=546364 RepID=A0A1K1RGT9_9PSEU|nr:hypothetical protein [Amycolatopsis australiensis]SFW71011.1 hypothetical protein SAMN04489730_3205 [Amycolatopsis australiensis]